MTVWAVADVPDATVVSWVKDGGVALFALAVLIHLRDFRKELVPLLKSLGETQTALLERDRMRPTTAPHAVVLPPAPSTLGAPPPPYRRPRTNPRGNPVRRKTEGDGSDG